MRTSCWWSSSLHTGWLLSLIVFGHNFRSPCKNSRIIGRFSPNRTVCSRNILFNTIRTVKAVMRTSKLEEVQLLRRNLECVLIISMITKIQKKIHPHFRILPWKGRYQYPFPPKYRPWPLQTFYPTNQPPHPFPWFCPFVTSIIH